jgi:non-ribosomal peptide synthetase component F
MLQETEMIEKLNWWRNQLKDCTVLNLPFNFARPLVQSNIGATVRFTIPSLVVTGLSQISAEQGTTLYMTLLAALQVLLHRYTAQEDICIGTPVSGRPLRELDEMIGFFINTVVMRTQVQGSLRFKELLQRTRQTTLNALQNQDIPFEMIVDSVVKERKPGISPLFQVLFDYQKQSPGQNNRIDLDGLQVTPLQVATHRAKFDLAFSFVEEAGLIQGNLEYCVELFREETVQQMLKHFLLVLDSITTTPEICLADIRLQHNGPLNHRTIPDRLPVEMNALFDFEMDKPAS